MPDKYASFLHLDVAEPPGSFIIMYVPRASSVVCIAPHGGKIEPGTSEVCRAIAANDLTFYLFEGCKPANNFDLHITSSCFDEPQGMAAVRSGQIVIALHGQSGSAEFVNVGGIDWSLGDAIIHGLQKAGYMAGRPNDQNLKGMSTRNICNQGQSGRGVQLEISRGLRNRLVASDSEMRRFASAVRAALAAHGL